MADTDEKELRDPSLMKKEEDLAKVREKKVPDRSNSWDKGQEARETWYIWRALQAHHSMIKARWRGCHGPNCLGGFSYVEELGLDSKDNGDPLGSIWQESDMTKIAFWKTLSSSRVENVLGWRRVNLEAGDPLGGF